EDHRQTPGVGAQLAFRDVRREFLDIGAAVIAGDLVAADFDEAQRAARALARGVPPLLGSGIAVRNIELVLGLPGLPVDKAAQTIEIRLRHAEKRRRMLRPGADE